MKLTQLRTNHFTEPLGMAIPGGKPVFSFVAEDTADKKQEAAQIKIFGPDGLQVYDSGRRGTLSSLGFEADFTPVPRTRYRWEVTVWGDGGDSACASSFFETAKQQEPWQGKWIAAQGDKDAHTYLTSDFTVSKGIRSARVYACGLGVYELELNGEKAGDEYLLPGFHSYDLFLEYQTFDVTELLRPGENRLGFSLGAGWYKGRFTLDWCKDAYGDTMKAICELHLTYEDGSEEVLVSDESWECLPSPVLFSGIYDGEHADARKEIPGWSAPGCTVKGTPVQVLPDQSDTEKLTPRMGPKLVKKQRFAPVEILHTKKGETVLDFGQNMTGWVEFDADEPEGTEIRLSYGEILQEGCFYRDNLRTAKAEFLYFSNGRPAHVRPHFTFYGFRFVKVEGVQSLRGEDFTAWHIRSDIDQTGSIETDHPMVNRLFLNALWGQFDNFLDVPTDCPQRDERLGWTGDAALISATACKNNYLPAFFHHYMVNMQHEQAYFEGAVPFFVPCPKSDGSENPFWRDGHVQGCAIWSDAATLVPWAVYENYGDTNLLRQEYPVMKAWVERILRDDKADGGRGLWLRGMQLGDWLALDKPDSADPQSPFGATSLPYTATAFYYWSSLLTAKAAGALGYTEDEGAYRKLSDKIKAAFLAEYFDGDGNFTVEGTQTACVLSLFLGLYPDGGRDTVLCQLKARLKARDNHLDTGFCGTPFLCRVLSDNGANDLAYTLFLNDDFPSWLYEVKMGATTVWERWNSVLPDGSISGTGMNSLNHYAYGAIADWMYRNLCGMNPCEDAPGYKKALIRPMPDSRIGKATLTMNTASGLYRVFWCFDGNALRYEITVPFDCEATLVLPDGRTEQLTAGEYKF